MYSTVLSLFSRHIGKNSFEYLRLRSTNSSLPVLAIRQSRYQFSNPGLQRASSIYRVQFRAFRSPFKVVGLSGLGIGLLAWMRPAIKCEPAPSTTPAQQTSGQADDPLPPPPPGSIVSYYELSFGTVAGICAGVFLKKGAKAVAFLFGGIFVLLQYLNSSSIIRVNWQRMGQRFETLISETDASGKKKAPTVYSAWHWLVDFLTADFQPRASFIAGLVLGLRIG